jgi:hypothetical protein
MAPSAASIEHRIHAEMRRSTLEYRLRETDAAHISTSLLRQRFTGPQLHEVMILFLALDRAMVTALPHKVVSHRS